MTSTELAVQIVRGDRPLADVARLGVSVSITPLFFTLDEPPRMRPVVPTIDDVAVGFLTHLREPDELREWATVVLGITAIDLSALHDDPQGEAMFEGLWAASTGEAVGPSALRAIAAVLRRSGHL